MNKEFDSIRHRIKMVAQWVIPFCVITFIMAITMLIVEHVTKVTSYHLTSADLGVIFSFSIFLLVVGIAILLSFVRYRILHKH